MPAAPTWVSNNLNGPLLWDANSLRPMPTIHCGLHGLTRVPAQSTWQVVLRSDSIEPWIYDSSDPSTWMNSFDLTNHIVDSASEAQGDTGIIYEFVLFRMVFTATGRPCSNRAFLMHREATMVPVMQ